MSTITGTCYFPSYGAAMRYYRPYLSVASTNRNTRTDACRRLVDEKINAGEIHIGKPVLKPGDTMQIKDNRYHITTP